MFPTNTFNYPYEFPYFFFLFDLGINIGWGLDRVNLWFILMRLVGANISSVCLLSLYSVSPNCVFSLRVLTSLFSTHVTWVLPSPFFISWPFCKSKVFSFLLLPLEIEYKFSISGTSLPNTVTKISVVFLFLFFVSCCLCKICLCSIYLFCLCKY